MTFMIFKVSLLQCDQHLNHNARNVKWKGKIFLLGFSWNFLRNRRMQFRKHRCRNIKG